MIVSTKELASKLKVHPETIRRMVRRKQIPVIKISETDYKFNLEDVIKTLEGK